MGTRSLTKVHDEAGQILLAMYGQWDGYIVGGVGEDLMKFLHRMKITDGIGNYGAKNTANGIQCLAAQIVPHFKRSTRKTEHSPAQSSIGRFYLVPHTQENEEYTYTVRITESNQIFVRAEFSVWDEKNRISVPQNMEKTPAQWIAYIRQEKRKKSRQKATATVS